MNSANLTQDIGPNLLDTVGQGVLWGIMVLGMYITFELLDITDLTVGGSFTLEDCVCATLIVDGGMNPVAVLVIATPAGMAAGFVTGILYTVFGIPSILAGILTQISLWSINLWVMEGNGNIPFLRSKTIVTMVSSSAGFNQAQASQVIEVATTILMMAMMYWFFGMEIESTLRTAGNNEDIIRTLGINIKWTRLLALMLSNSLMGMSGALICRDRKYVDIQMSTGAIVIDLAAIIIGEMLLDWFYNFALKLSAAVISSVIYFAIRVFVIKTGMNPSYMKFLSAIMVTLALCIPMTANKWGTYKGYSERGDA